MEKTVVVKIDPHHPDEGAISRAAEILKNGGLVAFPTETVYGLAANLFDEKAIQRLYEVKKRPEGKPFTVHIADRALIEKMGCDITAEAKALADAFWPGPLTMLLNSRDGRKIGFRMPKNTVALELIRVSRLPIAAPSANISGKKPPVASADVLKDLDGKIDMILDAGKTRLGIESTIVDLTEKPPRIVREGAITRDELSRVLGQVI